MSTGVGAVGGSVARAPRAPWWASRVGVLEHLVVAIIVISLVLQGVLITLEPVGRWGGVAGILLTGGALWAGSFAGRQAPHRRPHLGLALYAFSPLAAALLGWRPIAFWTLACFGVFLLTLRGLPLMVAAFTAGVASLGASGLYAGTIAPTADPEPAIALGAAFALATAGNSIHGHMQYWAELESRTRDAIATRQAAVDRSIAEERVRIARDLHDSVGHKIAVVSMHLGAAEVHLPDGADAARADLDAARQSVQAVLRETQQILRVLRVGPGDDADGAPLAEYARIGDLVATFRSAGLAVHAHVADLADRLAPDSSAAAYRIVQESLTNAQRYGTGDVSLDVRSSDDGRYVVVEVVNGRDAAVPRSTAGGGNGIVGMRERAAAAGGTLTVRPDGDRFRVTALLPVQPPVEPAPPPARPEPPPLPVLEEEDR